MSSTAQSNARPKMSCDACPFRKFADKTPSGFFARLWEWHTGFCPGWKRYVKARFEHGESAPERGSRRGYWES